jgi:type III secretion protein HrpB1
MTVSTVAQEAGGTPSELFLLAQKVQKQLNDGQLDAAEADLALLAKAPGVSETHDGLLMLKVGIMLARGNVRDAYRCVTGLESTAARALQAICLRNLNDPLWDGMARSVRDEATGPIRIAMEQLLQDGTPDRW